MELFNIRFGRRGGKDKCELEDIIETYLARLFRVGQIGREYFFSWKRGVLSAYVHVAGSTAHQLRYHSDYGKESLAKVKEAFGKDPVWIPLDDEAGKRPISWRGAPFLYLFTHAFDYKSPVCRGDNGDPVPLYLVPVSFADKESISTWQWKYVEHDNIWLGSGVLEIPAYRQLAEPSSELSEDGRQLCKVIEKATSIPTYYYLMRHSAKARGEEDRRCPGCGGKWRTNHPIDDCEKFCEFTFQCRKCRLVSHVGPSLDGERLAAIGDYRGRKPGKRN